MTESAGSCLCGAVRYSLQGRFDRFYLCHCAHCRKDSGSSHSANLFAPGATLAWRSGEDQVATFRLPGSRHARAFCTFCGSALPFSSADVVVVPAGSLDTAVDLRPDGHLFTARRAPWDHDLDAVPSFDTFPA